MERKGESIDEAQIDGMASKTDGCGSRRGSGGIIVSGCAVPAGPSSHCSSSLMSIVNQECVYTTCMLQRPEPPRCYAEVVTKSVSVKYRNRIVPGVGLGLARRSRELSLAVTIICRSESAGVARSCHGLAVCWWRLWYLWGSHPVRREGPVATWLLSSFHLPPAWCFQPASSGRRCLRPQ